MNSSRFDEFLCGYASAQTRKVYTLFLTKWAGVNGFQSVDECLEAVRAWSYEQGTLKIGKSEPPPKSDRQLNTFDSIRRYLSAVKAPQSQVSGKSAIRLFLVRNGVQLSNEELREQVQTKVKLYRLSQDRIPTIEELRSILLRGSLRLKVAVGCMSTGGFRIGELVQLRVGWIAWGNGKPTSITLPAQITKAKKERITFLTKEVSDLLKQYLDKEGKTTQPDALILDSTINSLRANVDRLVYTLGLRTKKPGSQRYELHVHTFRKFFFTRLQNAGMPQGLVDVLVGHETPLAQAYGRSTDEEKAREYAKYNHALTILNVASPAVNMQEMKLEIIRDLNRKHVAQTYGPEWVELVCKQLEQKLGRTPTAQEENDWLELQVRQERQTGNGGNGKTKRFENHEFRYVRTRMASDDYEQALIDGYEQFSQNGETAYLRKRKQ